MIFSQQILSGKLLLSFNWDNHFKLCIKKNNKQKIKRRKKHKPMIKKKKKSTIATVATMPMEQTKESLFVHRCFL